MFIPLQLHRKTFIRPVLFGPKQGYYSSFTESFPNVTRGEFGTEFAIVMLKQNSWNMKNSLGNIPECDQNKDK